MRRVLTPCVSAASRSWAAARMAKPARVPRMNRRRTPASAASAITTTISRSTGTMMSPSISTRPRPAGCCARARPRQHRAEHHHHVEAEQADHALEHALVEPAKHQPLQHRARRAPRPARPPAGRGASARCQSLIRWNSAKAPSMANSPCAKLTTRMMPNSSVKPSATRI